MSCWMTNGLGRAGSRMAGVRSLPGASGGVGLLEFLIALLIFSLGMLGLISTQLAGKRASFDAGQRSVATALARDILERIRANPGELAAYRVVVGGDQSQRLPAPPRDCESVTCTTPELAAFDVWQWESQLFGESERAGDYAAGGLVAPRACITGAGGEVTVTISWLGRAPADGTAQAACLGGGAESRAPGEGDDAAAPRQHLTMTGFVAR